MGISCRIVVAEIGSGYRYNQCGKISLVNGDIDINEDDLIKIAQKGEDSRSQFKSDVASPDALAAEIVSLLNASGGTIYLGISGHQR